MRRRELFRRTVVVATGLLAYAAGGRGAAASVNAARYTLPPGRQSVHVSTGARPPLRNVRFVIGGSPDVKTERIQGTTGLPDITFNPPARPSDVTIHFAQRPIVSSEATEFTVTLINESGRTLEVEIVVRYD